MQIHIYSPMLYNPYTIILTKTIAILAFPFRVFTFYIGPIVVEPNQCTDVTNKTFSSTCGSH